MELTEASPEKAATPGRGEIRSQAVARLVPMAGMPPADRLAATMAVRQPVVVLSVRAVALLPVAKWSVLAEAVRPGDVSWGLVAVPLQEAKSSVPEEAPQPAVAWWVPVVAVPLAAVWSGPMVMVPQVVLSAVPEAAPLVGAWFMVLTAVMLPDSCMCPLPHVIITEP